MDSLKASGTRLVEPLAMLACGITWTLAWTLVTSIMKNHGYYLSKTNPLITYGPKI